MRLQCFETASRERSSISFCFSPRSSRAPREKCRVNAVELQSPLWLCGSVRVTQFSSSRILAERTEVVEHGLAGTGAGVDVVAGSGDEIGDDRTDFAHILRAGQHARVGATV